MIMDTLATEEAPEAKRLQAPVLDEEVAELLAAEAEQAAADEAEAAAAQASPDLPMAAFEAFEEEEMPLVEDCAFD